MENAGLLRAKQTDGKKSGEDDMREGRRGREESILFFRESRFGGIML